MGNRAVITSFTTGFESSETMIEKIIQHHGGDPMLLRVDLEILRHLAKREQMIEDHKLYMGAVKE